VNNRAESIKKLIANGYLLIPIVKGQKRPAVKDWQNLRVTDPKELAGFDGGLGILTGVKNSNGLCAVGVDIDSMDGELVTELISSGLKGMANRTGLAPKKLILGISIDEFPKMSSRKFIDSEGDIHQLEILGKGQQFVAFGKHPDTGKNYHWDAALNPLDKSTKDLALFSLLGIKELIQRFEKIALSKGYTPRSSNSKALSKISDSEEGHPLMTYEPPVDLKGVDLAAKLELIDCEDYDIWLKVGMALHHQFGGRDHGFELWDEWSAQGMEYKGSEDLKARWVDFKIAKSGGSVTLRSVLSMAHDIEREAEQAKRKARFDKAQGMVKDCAEAGDLIDDLLPKIAKGFFKDTLHLDLLQKAVQAKFNKLSDSSEKISLPEIKKICKPIQYSERQKGLDCPKWAEDYVFVTGREKFYHKTMCALIGEKGFRGAHNHELGGEDSAAFILNHALIPIVNQVLYFPGQGELFTANGVTSVNSYSDVGALDLSEGGKAFRFAVGEELPEAAQCFKDHISLICSGKRSAEGGFTRGARLLTNFLRKNIESPGDRVNWAVFLQGAQGDGKSEPFHWLMGRLLGPKNVKVVNARTIEKSDFTDWAVGSCFTMIEEVKLQGHNRYDVMNSLKPLITNETIEVHPKGHPAYTAPNTTSYFAVSNYRDGIPIEETDRRYFVLFSQMPETVRRSAAYYDRLFGFINDTEGCKSIGRWILNELYHEDFKPKGHPPLTEAKKQAIMFTANNEVEQIADIIEESNSPYISQDQLIFDCLADVVSHEGVEIAHSKLLVKYLGELGFEPLGRFRVDIGDGQSAKKHRLWAKRSICVEEFRENIEIRKMLF
jgi:hypothetical protein